MSEYRAEVVRAVEPILAAFTAHNSTAAPFAHEAWKSVTDGGYTLLSVPEGSGGSGGDVEDLLALVETAARIGVDLPLVEHGLLGGGALAESGLPVSDATMTAAVTDTVHATPTNGGWSLTGAVTAVPWLHIADQLILLIVRGAPEAPLVVAVDLDAARELLVIESITNLAGEARDTVRFSGLVVPTEQVAEAPRSVSADSWMLRGALGRVTQLAGAARTVLSLSLAHTQVREQFGRPISKFQVVQHDLARLAEEVSALGIAADAAGRLFTADPDSNAARFAVAAAKSYGSAAAYEIAGLAHQLHGALGLTLEHRLGWFTKRLWSWRDEFGSETYWNRVLGQHSLAAATPWAAITDATIIEGRVED